MICKDIIKNYLSFLKESFIVEETNRGCHITTPFIRYDGEIIDIYIEQLDSDRLRLTDAGNTLMDLEVVNINVNFGREQELFLELLKLFEIYEESGELYYDTNLKMLPQKLSIFINALQSISDLEYLKTPSRLKSFHQIVHEYCVMNQFEHKYLYQLPIGDGIYTIDVSSIDIKNLIQTFGTQVEIPRNMVRFTEQKIFPYLLMETDKYKIEKEKYYRYAMYDDSIDWDNQSMALMEDYTDDIIKWSERKKLEPLLTIKD